MFLWFVKQILGIVLLSAGALIGCKSESVSEEPVIDKEEVEEVYVEPYDSSTHKALEKLGLIDIHLVDSTIQVDLRYATENNFMGQVLYDTLEHLFLQKEVAERLAACQAFLKDTFPNYSLLLYDGVRPLGVQQEMWDALDSIPPLNRGKFVSNPASGSVHNFGAAVDVTICDQHGKSLDMGAGYDDFRPVAFPSLEWKFLQSGELTKEQWKNRKLLRFVMKSQKFRNIPSEWWHFNACSRITAASKYPKLLHESGND